MLVPDRALGTDQSGRYLLLVNDEDVVDPVLGPVTLEQADCLQWGFVLDEITGLGVIEDPDDFSPVEVKQRWITWWQRQQETTPAEKAI